MAIYEHVTDFAGYPVRDFDPAIPLEDPANTVYRLSEVPEREPVQVEMLGSIGMLLGVAVGIGFGVVTGKFWWSVAVAVVSAIVLGSVPIVVWSAVQRLRLPRCPYCRVRLQQPETPRCPECKARLRQEDEEPLTTEDEALRELLDDVGGIGTMLGELITKPNANLVPGLIICGVDWEGLAQSAADPYFKPLVAVRERLPNLKALFLSELTGDECEISWIEHGDVSPIFDAYPNLEHFQIRGCGSLSMGKLSHSTLKRLAIESGGLSAEVVREVAAADLPQLEHLELWLGTSLYGGDATVDDIKAVLLSEGYPQLHYLGLRNCEILDDVVAVLVRSPLIERLSVLDLSLGCLSDAGAELLLACPAVAQLDMLDIHYHFVSDPMVRRLEVLGVEIDASEPQDPEGLENESGEPERYCAVGE